MKLYVSFTTDELEAMLRGEELSLRLPDGETMCFIEESAYEQKPQEEKNYHGARMENIEDKRRHDALPDVKQIRKEIKTRLTRFLAAKYGVSHTAIRKAANGLKWNYLKEGIA